jgi:predicted phosphodiesterase
MSYLNEFLEEYTICSDIHIERFYPDVPTITKFIPKESLKDKIIFAGDVGRVEFFGQYCKFFVQCFPLFKKMILVPGNHEYYTPFTKKSMEEIDKKLDFLSSIVPNLTILRNKSVVNEKSKIIVYGCTLFSLAPLNLEIKLPIYSNSKLLTVLEFNRLFLDNLIGVQQMIDEKPNGYKLIVVTHYAPTFIKTINDKYMYLENKRKHLYSTNLDHLLKREKVDIWIYGHTGHNASFTTNNGTDVYSNQICNDLNEE